MKSKLNIFLFSVYLLIACKGGLDRSEDNSLFLMIKHVQTVSSKRIIDTTYQKVLNDSFTVDLVELTDSKFIAMHTLIPPNNLKDFEFKFYTLVDKYHKTAEFEKPHAFIEYMAERDYYLDGDLNGKTYSFLRKSTLEGN